jgi:PAS domain S-box-containing protein
MASPNERRMNRGSPMASSSGPKGARLSPLRRLTPSQRILLMPVVAAVAFLMLFGLNWRASVRAEKLVTRIEAGYVPALELAVGLTQSLAQLQRALQDAVTASDRDALRESDAAKADLVRQLQVGRKNSTLNAEELKTLEASVEEYFDLARATALAMIERRPGTDLSTSLAQMTRGYTSLKDQLDALLTRQKREMRSAFASTQAAQRTSAELFGGVVLVCLVLLVGLSGVIGRSQERTAEAYRESEERYRNLFELLSRSQKMLQDAQRTAHIGSWEWDIGVDRIVWSDELYRIFGQDPETFHPTLPGFLGVVHPDDRAEIQARIEDWMETGDPSKSILRVVKRDGEIRSLLSDGSVVRDETGRTVRIFGTCQDVTEQRQLEDQLRQSQKMEAVGRLAGGVAHDFNNLLTVIQGYADLLLDEAAADEPTGHTEAIEQIRVASQRAAALTSQLLAFSRQQVLESKVLDLNAIVSNLAPMLHRLIGENITLVTNLDPEGSSVVADAGQIGQVVMNLVVNSRDAMPQGGILTIETGSVDSAELPDVESGTPPGRYARLTVKDTGVGLSPEVKARVFEPFFTTKEVGKGTGLGLATVYGIVKQSGGFVQLHSEPGQGATFDVYLPCVEGETPRVKLTSGVAPALPSEKVVLLIEDEDAVRKLLSSVLGSQGYTVLKAGGGEEAIRAASDHPGPIHLIISDVVMPGIGGPETVAEILRARPGTRVIFMSGYTDDRVVRHDLTDAGRHFLQKPFSPATLLKKMREVLRDAPAPARGSG